MRNEDTVMATDPDNPGTVSRKYGELVPHDAERKKTYEELKADGKLFRTLSKVVPVGIFRTNPVGECLYVNERWQKIAGLSEVEALGSGWTQAIHPDDRAQVSLEWSRCTEHSIPFSLEYRFQHPDGVITWVLGQAFVEKDALGDAISYFGTITDITERKAIEDKLRTSEAHLKEAQRLTNLGSWERNYSSGSLHWSDEMFRITELDPTDFNDTFENYLYVVHPEDRNRFLQAAHDAHKAQAPYELEYRLKMPDGRVKWVHSRGSASYDRKGQPLIMTGTTQDITKRKLSDETLRHNEALLSLIINAVPALISYVDTEYRYRLVNQGYAEQFRVSLDTIRGRQVRDVLGEAVWATACPFVKRALAGERVSYEVMLPNHLGGMSLYLAVYIPDRDAERRIQGYVALAYDITEQKTTEMTLRRYGQRLTELEEEVRRKLAAELHDEMGPELTALNFNLALIRGSANTAQGQHVDELVADSVQLIDGLTSKVRNIISRLQPPVLFDYGLEAAIRWYIDHMKNRTTMTISIVTTGAVPRLPEEHELALFRIIKEALINAAKYSGAKNVTVTLGTAGSTLRLSVSDDGVGFDRATVSLPGAGGWGLTIMRERTNILGGSFRLETAPGEGVTIHLEIPKESVDAD
jgi:PAS domain S-box-containing protein